jgi:hypothetical protein
MPAIAIRRLAGFAFQVQPPVLAEKLPRMDIAVFVGFASAGPLNRPVVVADVTHFKDIFGDDLPLAWDTRRSEQVYAYLAPAVRAFFRQGGLRCWVIRVSGDSETDFFPVPGLAQFAEGEIRPAFARARSPGSWFDSFECATALASSSVEILAPLTPDFATLDVRLSAVDKLLPGDLLRLTLEGERAQLFFMVTQTNPLITSPPETRLNRYVVKGQPLVWLLPVAPAEFGTEPCHITWTRSPQFGDQPPEQISVPGFILGTESSPPENSGIAGDRKKADGPLTLSAPVDFTPPPGTLLEINLGSDVIWLNVQQVQFHSEDTGSPPARSARISGQAFRWLKNGPTRTPSSPPLGEKLTFELQVHSGHADALRLIDLGFAPGDPRFWNALPPDQILFQFEDIDSSVRDAQAEAYRDLWLAARHPRFPLAGDGTLGGLFFPLGMSALPAPFLQPRNSERSALERDGLSKFDAIIFLDEALLESGTDDLMTDADFLRYQSPQSRPLSGIHAALQVEEATLIAVPDAVHRGWERAKPEKPPDPKPSLPLSHPEWGLSDDCNVLASPPTGDNPRWDKFLKCYLRVLVPPPGLWVGSQPDALGTFTLAWDIDEPDVQFVLQESTEPDFSGAVVIYNGPDTSRTLYGRAVGHYYYRVRAEAGTETSNWSNGVVATISPPTGWLLKSEADYRAEPILDIHRSLLRLCAARGDLLAALALPEHFHEEEALAYLNRLKSSGDEWFVTGAELTLPLGGDEARAFSYGAIYHPWLIGREEDLVLRTTPPDAASIGIIARRAIERGAWIAPANELFRGVVALFPILNPDRRLDLLLTQLNQIQQNPTGFLALNADTLSDDPDLRPINVRRLLILLRRTALRLGMTYVFEPNGTALRRLVQRAFESVMDQLFMRGAFAGATRATSYQVVTDDGVNPPESVDQGRFRVDLKIAPSLPMSFVTVRLVQLGENGFVTEIF